MPNTSGPWKPFGANDKYSTGDANYQSRGFHVVLSIAEMLAITPARRKGVFTAEGANATPYPTHCFVLDKGDGSPGTYFLINEPGTPETTISDWQIKTETNSNGGLGLFNPATTTLVNGVGSAGNWYIADSAGTFNGETYDKGDWAVYNGSEWERLAIGITALPPSAHQHPISEVTGLQTELNNKVGTGDIATSVAANNKIPTNQAVVDYTYPKATVDDKIATAKSEAIDEAVNDTTVSNSTAYSSFKTEERLTQIAQSAGVYTDADAIDAAITNIGTGATNFKAGNSTEIDDNNPSPYTTFSGNYINSQVADANTLAQEAIAYSNSVTGELYALTDRVEVLETAGTGGGTHPTEIELTGAAPTWNVTTHKFAYLTASADTDVALTLANSEAGIMRFTQDATGSFTLALNGADIDVNPAAETDTTIEVYKIDGRITAHSRYSATIPPPTPITPAAPTNPVTDDTADEFKADVVSGYTNVSDYEIEIV